MEKAADLHYWETQIHLARGAGVMAFLRIGRALEAIKDGDLWQPIASTFEAYLEHSWGIKRAWGYALVGVWQTWGQALLDDKSLQEVEVTRLVKLLPLTTTENSAEMLHMAANVPDLRGFENNIRNLRGKKGTDECTHDFQLISLEVCTICGLKRKI